MLNNRWAHRDATMILVAYRPGLRASELTDLRWDQIDFATATLHVRRAKQGSPSTHPRKSCGCCGGSSANKSHSLRFVFTSERGSPFTTAGFARMVERAGVEAKLAFKAHPQMSRHACGIALASHENIQHTVRYTALSPTRFKTFWQA